MKIIVALLLLCACSTEKNDREQWQDYVRAHECREGNGMWKCQWPTPGWWIEVDK